MSVFKRILCNKNIECRVYEDKNGSRYVLFGAGFMEGEEVGEEVYYNFSKTSGLTLTGDTFTLYKDNEYMFDHVFCDEHNAYTQHLLIMGKDPREFGMLVPS